MVVHVGLKRGRPTRELDEVLEMISTAASVKDVKAQIRFRVEGSAAILEELRAALGDDFSIEVDSSHQSD